MTHPLIRRLLRNAIPIDQLSRRVARAAASPSYWLATKRHAESPDTVRSVIRYFGLRKRPLTGTRTRP